MISKLKNSVTSRETTDIRLRSFNKPSTGEGYGELRTSADLQGLVHPGGSREYESGGDVYSSHKASVQSESGRASKSEINGTLKKPVSGPHTIRVTTEFDVRNVVGNDAARPYPLS